MDIDAILAQMTLEEKIAQLNQTTCGEPADEDPARRQQALADLIGRVSTGRAGTFLGGAGAAFLNRLQEAALSGSRQRIPALFAHDMIHGTRVVFPTPLAESCSWDVDLAERTARVAAREARATGIRWTFAPMVDIARDPRWGRIVEGSGEDTLLGSALAVARVRGFQGRAWAPGVRLDDDRVLACAKHFAAYGAAEGGRDYNTVDISMETLQQVYLPPFRASVDAGVATFMTAFNEINGVPCTGSPWLMKHTLREQWGFQGVIVTDYTAIMEMVNHGYARDAAHGAQLSIDSTIDIDMVSEFFLNQLPGLVRAGKVTESQINDSTRRVLEIKKSVGLFENPMVSVEEEARVLNAPEHRALAREAAGKSIVMLKNSGVLPLGESVKRIAVIGPIAGDQKTALGTWAGLGKADEAISPLAGIRSAAESRSIMVTSASGGTAETITQSQLDEAKAAAMQADVIVLVLGETAEMSGEGHSRAVLELPEAQIKLLDSMKSLRKPLVVALSTGRPIPAPWSEEGVDALLMVWHLGSEAGSGLADVLFGDVNPSGRMTTSVPRTTGQVPMYYNHKNTGRPHVAGQRYTTGYLDTPNSPQFEFGYGLSYTTFELTGLRVDREDLAPGEAVRVSVTVKNTGARAGAEVVQVYARVPVASTTRPVKELVGFERVELEPGQSRVVEMDLARERFAALDRAGRPIIEAGHVRLHAAGGNVKTDPVTVRLLEAR